MTFPNNEEVSKKIAEVKGIKLPEVEPMTRQLETFIRRQTFVATQHEVSDMYNEGKPEEAMLLLEKRMAEINAFSLDKFRGKFVRLFKKLTYRTYKRFQIFRMNTIIHISRIGR